MVNNNNLMPKTETVCEIKDEYKIPTYEEFMKTYEGNKETVDSYNGEFESYDGLGIKGTYYGPGFWDDIKGIVKPIATGALVVASVFPPTAAIAAPVAYGVIGTGVATVGLGHITDDKDVKEFGKDLLEIGTGARDVQGGVCESYEAPLNQYARSRNGN